MFWRYNLHRNQVTLVLWQMYSVSKMTFESRSCWRLTLLESGRAICGAPYKKSTKTYRDHDSSSCRPRRVAGTLWRRLAHSISAHCSCVDKLLGAPNDSCLFQTSVSHSLVASVKQLLIANEKTLFIMCCSHRKMIQLYNNQRITKRWSLKQRSHQWTIESMELSHKETGTIFDFMSIITFI